MIPDGQPGKRRYGEWAGNPKGHAEDVLRCIEEVFGRFLSHQCIRKRGHGPNGDFCKQHGAKAAARSDRTTTTRG